MTSPPGWSTPPPPPPPPPGQVGSGGSSLRPLNLGDVLDGMFRLFIRHWRTYVVAIAVIIVPAQLVLAYLQRELASDIGLLDMLSDPMALQASAAAGPGGSELAGAMTTGYLVSLLTTPLITGLACFIGARAHLGQEVEAGLALRAGLRRYGALLLSHVLFLLALGVVAGACALSIVFFLGILSGVGASGPVVALLAVPLVLLAICGVMAVFTFLWLAPAAIMIEGRGPISGLVRSASLVRHRFWGVLGIGLLAWVISGIVAMVLAWPFTLPAGLFGGAALFLALTTVGGIVAGVFGAPLLPNAISLLYLDLRVRAEGMDLEAMASAVEHSGGGRTPA